LSHPVRVTSLAAGSLGAPVRRVAPARYHIAALLLLIPTADFLSSIAPYQLGDPKWRFASVALFAGFLLTPLLGIALLLLTAVLLQHGGVLRVTSWACLLIALALIGSAALLALDTIQVRAAADPQIKLALAISGARAVLKNLLVGVALLVAFWGGRGAAQSLGTPAATSEPITPFIGKPRL
jgi:hypothetical protein